MAVGQQLLIKHGVRQMLIVVRGNSTLTITVDANSTSDARTANVIIKCSNIEKKVTVKQAAGEFIPSENDNGIPPTPAPKK